MTLGLLCIIGSLFAATNWVSALCGALGGSLIWGATELKEQAVRGELGWYPFNGKKIDPPLVKIIKKWKAPSL
jgi:hypothetical protein